MSTKSTCAISSAISFLTSAAISCTNSAQILLSHQAGRQGAGGREIGAWEEKRRTAMSSRVNARDLANAEYVTEVGGILRLAQDDKRIIRRQHRPTRSELTTDN